jgi:CBS domain-containing protein
MSSPADADAALSLVALPVRALLHREPVSLPPQASIRQAALLMRDQRVSSVLVIERDHLFGVVTDRDLRNRAVADALDLQRPISDITTLAPISIPAQDSAFEAMLLMARHNIHHLPVLDGTRVVGMITATDLTDQSSISPVHVSGDIHKQDSIEGLQRASAKVQRLQRSLAATGASAYNTGHVITSVTDAITTRLLQLGEARLGPPPVGYVWVAAGSQARNEQTARTDQDNCMVLEDAYDEAQHGAYFESLARFVCDGLDACGYEHCPGGIMAMTPRWRQPLHRWRMLFAEWTDQPEPQALLWLSVFFDLRAIHGQTALLDALRRDVLRRTKSNGLFLAHMTANALNRRPPLGLFRRLVTLRDNAHKGTINLKLTGIAPIVELARVQALASGHDAVNTHDRLLAVADHADVGEQSARDLRDALEFLSSLRIRHQARQMAQGTMPDNFLPPASLSNFERTQLKDAFAVVDSLQRMLRQRFQPGSY